MQSNEIRKKYLQFFKEKGHKIIPSTSLIPENDPTTLFTSAGMQPLIPYLLGETHPEGNRLAGSQKCLRTDDINEVGDNIHHTFFEMLGNWSLGDYFKKEAINFSYEFLTTSNGLNLPKEKLAISVFAGDQDAPFDKDSYQIWLDLGLPKERIAKLPKKNNWWGPAGQTGPCGPDTEMFYWSSKDLPPKNFDPDDIRWVEIWNDVFMQYLKNEDGNFKLLKQQNVDTGMGLERTLAALNNTDDNYQTDLFLPIIEKLELLTSKKYQENLKEFRIIADHIKAATFLIKDGITPSNKLQGYVLRRLIRRSAIKTNSLKENSMEILSKLVDPVIDIYADTDYFQTGDWDKIRQVIQDEVQKFQKTLRLGLKEFDKLQTVTLSKERGLITGEQAFRLYQTYGFPIELTQEIAREKGLEINLEEFNDEVKKHQEQSRTLSSGIFKGGLADNEEQTTKLHTATHLLQATLKKVLGPKVGQRGSNITVERLRFDFNYDQKLTEQQLKEVEDLVNKQIQKNLPVWYEIEDRDEAIKKGALTNYGEHYPTQVKVYKIGEKDTSLTTHHSSLFSQELCGGPHVENTSVLKSFKIIKQESAGAGIRRIYATVES